MFRLSIRSLLAKKLRLLTTTIAIVLGVAFTAGTMILADTMSASFSTTIADVNDGVDTVVRGDRLDPDDPFSPRAPIPADTLDTVLALPGVVSAVPYYEGYTQVLDIDGKALDVLQSVGFNWIDDPDLTMFRLTDGAVPARAGEVVLGGDAADDSGLSIGDPVDLMTILGRETFTIVGLSELKSGSSLGNSAFVFFHQDDAATRLADPGSVDSVYVRGDDTRTERELTAAVVATLPTLNVVSGADHIAEQQSDIDDAIEVLETILLVFGFIALFVGSFTIANTFTITIAQRTKELALVRAVGASRGQVLGSVVIEAGLLGTIAAALGLFGGLGVAKGLTALFGAIGLEFPSRALVVQPGTIVLSMAAGILVTVVAAITPARRAAAVAPVDAMRDASIERLDTSRRRLVTGVVLGAGGVALLALGAAQGSARTVGYGSLAAFFGVIALGPVLVRPIMAVLALPLRRLGVSGRMAAANASRNPKRSAATAAALTIGVTLVAGASMFASTAQATLGGDVEDVIIADRVLRPTGLNPGVPTDIAATIDLLDGAIAVPMQSTMAIVDDEVSDIGGLDLERAVDVLALDVVDGTIGSSGLAVEERFAEEQGWSVGDVVAVTFVDGASESIAIDAVVEQNSALPAVIAPYATVAPHGDDLDRLVFVNAPAETVATIEVMLDAAPTVVIESVDDFAASLAGSLDMVLNLVLGFLGLAVVIAVLGIATTIGLSVHERTRELGVLRAVGMSRRQLRRAIRLESIVIAVLGTVLGMALGVGCTWAVLSTLTDDGFASPVVPSGALVAVAVGALLAGTVAAALPARRASRLAVLDAVRAA